MIEIANYIDKWLKAKSKAKKEENKVMYTISKIMLNSLYERNKRSKIMIKGVKFQIEDLKGNKIKDVTYHFTELIESKANAFDKFIFDFNLFASAICFSGEYDVIVNWEDIVIMKFSDDVKDIAYIGLYTKDKKRFFNCVNFEFI